MQTQGLTKDPCAKEPKESKAFGPQRAKQPETSKLSWREKKKQHRQEQGRKGSTPATEDFTLATGDNTAISSRRKARKDLSHITYFNCGETGHKADKCPKPREESDSSVD